MRLIFKILPLILILFVFFPIQAQETEPYLKIEWIETEIPAGEYCGLQLSFSKEYRKVFLAFQQASFKEVPDLIKGRTLFKKNKTEDGKEEYLIIQLYKPRKTGSYKLPAVSYQIQGKVYIGQEVTLHVANHIHNYKSSIETPEIIEPLVYAEEKPDAFLQFNTSKNKIFQGEQFDIEIGFCMNPQSNAEITFFDLTEQRKEIIKKIKPTNCLLEDQYAEELEVDTITHNGKKYYRWIIYKASLYPADTLPIQMPTITFQVISYKTAKNGSSSIERRELSRSYTHPGHSIKVKSLPPHPNSEAVAVGSFTLKEDLSNRKVRTGKSITYTFTIAGVGNLTAIASPVTKLPAELDIFYPSIGSSTEHINGKNVVSKSYTYRIVPKVPGEYQLGDYLYWIYFNPALQRYDTLVPKASIKVEKHSRDSTIVEEHSSFYEQIFKESNRLRSKEKDKTTNFLVNLIILFMLVFTAILIFRK